jgi:hypothetical protein
MVGDAALREPRCEQRRNANHFSAPLQVVRLRKTLQYLEEAYVATTFPALSVQVVWLSMAAAPRTGRRFHRSESRRTHYSGSRRCARAPTVDRRRRPLSATVASRSREMVRWARCRERDSLPRRLRCGDPTPRWRGQVVACRGRRRLPNPEASASARDRLEAHGVLARKPHRSGNDNAPLLLHAGSV